MHDAPAIAEEDKLRADFYAFLSGLLHAAPDARKLAGIAELEGDDTEIGRSLRALAAVARARSAAAIAREHHELFVGLGRGELVPYASFYLTGFLNEKPLARLRRDMLRLGMEREEAAREPEDNIASLFEMMAGLIRGAFGAPASPAAQREFFSAHLGPWAEPFFADLEAAKSAVFYQPVGRLGGLLMRIEKEAFRISAAETARPGEARAG